MKSDEIARAERCFARAERQRARLFGRMRFLLAPKVDGCLAMLVDQETAHGGERQAAMVLGPSIMTVRSGKWRQKMSIPPRLLAWLAWVVALQPWGLETVSDLVTWGRSSEVRLRPTAAPV